MNRKWGIMVLFLFVFMMGLASFPTPAHAQQQSEVMRNYQEALRARGIVEPRPIRNPISLFFNVKEFGPNLAYLSGTLSHIEGTLSHTGRVNAEVSVEDAIKAAEITAANLLANIIDHFGSLDRVKSIVKMTTFVVAAPEFYALSQIANGACQFFIDVFGREKGTPARSTVGVSALVGNGPVEIEILIELYP